MTDESIRSGATPQSYPYDMLHPNRPYAETQRDIGGGLLIGALTLAALMTLVVLGLR